ncbi:ABC transporter substrate-binding protein [Pedobacter punctiformis]|uniref:Amino acid ABC transporter substrate-binding protein n=1 Tax=Pedobacter punctiformis TaxID=3004097 RepID=A0ABT4LCT1_9SPHI|nr:amino acid ABC transporter substrate-binding protein [Pedobacter sp. HCMS5-2]MCZ4245681.1 amino acid ABC transporter substrate-binding protein [Pedobacter sp. HCMS5-2]
MNFKSRYSLFVLFALLLAACSPKVRTPKKDDVKPKEKEKITEKKTIKKFSQASISLLVPFKLNQINLKTTTKADIEKYAMPIDFYQGFQLGLDSAATGGQNFKLNVFDTEDDNAHLSSLYKNERLKQSNLVIGPVFPDGVKHIKNFALENKLLVVSPLAATNPTEFDNPNLISIVNNINLHAGKIASYISKTYNPANTIVVLINPKKTEDEQFAAPIRNYFQTQSNNKFIFQEYASAFTFETKMIKGKQYVVIISTSDKAFVQSTIDKLYKLKNLPTGGYAINLFGHPNWIKQNYTADKLQGLNTIISSSYKIDYKNAAVVTFIKKYRSKYGFEPGEYAFKGFDIGYYFGRLLTSYGEEYQDYIVKDKYKGLHNSFSFIHDEKLGYINTSLMLLRYKNFALNLVE